MVLADFEVVFPFIQRPASPRCYIRSFVLPDIGSYIGLGNLVLGPNIGPQLCRDFLLRTRDVWLAPSSKYWQLIASLER